MPKIHKDVPDEYANASVKDQLAALKTKKLNATLLIDAAAAAPEPQGDEQ